MSGGAFDYTQYGLQRIIDSIEQEIAQNGQLIPKDKRAYWMLEDPNKEINYPEYVPGVIAEFKNAVYYLKKALIYANRVDWLLSGDDGEVNFMKRLEQELNELQKESTK